MKIKCAAICGALALAVATAAAGMAVHSITYLELDYSGYRTFTWEPRPGLHPEHPLAEGAELDRLIRKTAVRALARRGFVPVPEGEEPDLRITYLGLVEEVLTIEGAKYHLGGQVSWIGDPQAHSVRTYREGTLVFEIQDARSGKLAWSGWAVDVAADPEGLTRKAPKAVKKILAGFPPER